MLKKLLELSEGWANFWLCFDVLMWILGFARLTAYLFPRIADNSESGGFLLMCLIAVGYLMFRTVHGEG